MAHYWMENALTPGGAGRDDPEPVVGLGGMPPRVATMGQRHPDTPAEG